MGIIVQKYGGTSVADPEKIKSVARSVIREKNNGNNVVVVVSAVLPVFSGELSLPQADIETVTIAARATAKIFFIFTISLLIF